MIAGSVAVLTLALAGCGGPVSAPAAMTVGSDDSECTPAGAFADRITLRPSGDPAPDVSKLVMCWVPVNRGTVVINNTSMAWLVVTPPGTSVTQHGGVPLDVQAFREVATRTAQSGRWLEPGTALRAAAVPGSVRLVVAPDLQKQWLTYGILKAGAGKAKDQMPNLIRNRAYRAAATSCLDAGSRSLTAATDGPYRSQTLIEDIGLGAKSTQCGLDLKLANDERRSQALRLGQNVPDLPTSTFASEGSRLAGYLDEGLAGIGKLAQAAR